MPSSANQNEKPNRERLAPASASGCIATDLWAAQAEHLSCGWPGIVAALIQNQTGRTWSQTSCSGAKPGERRAIIAKVTAAADSFCSEI
jgi:hypothetical protein